MSGDIWDVGSGAWSFNEYILELLADAISCKVPSLVALDVFMSALQRLLRRFKYSPNDRFRCLDILWPVLIDVCCRSFSCSWFVLARASKMVILKSEHTFCYSICIGEGIVRSCAMCVRSRGIAVRLDPTAFYSSCVYLCSLLGKANVVVYSGHFLKPTVR